MYGRDYSFLGPRHIVDKYLILLYALIIMSFYYPVFCVLQLFTNLYNIHTKLMKVIQKMWNNAPLMAVNGELPLIGYDANIWYICILYLQYMQAIVHTDEDSKSEISIEFVSNGILYLIYNLTRAEYKWTVTVMYFFVF